MLSDRYLPADESDEYELTREDSGRHSHKHDRKHKKSKKEKKHRERSSERHRHSDKKHDHEDRSERSRKHHAADELEDGEIMEDGEIPDAAVQQTSEQPADLQGNGIKEHSPANNSRSPSPTNNSRQQHLSSPSKPVVSGEPGSRRESGHEDAPTASNHSRDPAAQGQSSRDRRNSRERSRDRSRERSSSKRAREQLQEDVEQPLRHSSKDPRERHSSRNPRERHSSRDVRDRHSSRDPRDRHSSRDPRERHSSRDPRERRSSADAAGRPDSRLSERADRSDRDRAREPNRFDMDRGRPDRYDRGYDRLDRDRQRAEAPPVDRRPRSSRSRSVERRLAAPRSFEERERERLASAPKSFEERERERLLHGSKRDRDDRDRRDRDGKRHRRSYSSDEELPNLPDPDTLASVDALGLTAAEREAEEERKRLEESRRRRQEILAKHQQASAVAAPTATAVAAAAAGASEPQQQQQHDPAVAGQQPAAGQNGQASTAAAGDAADGAATPEGERSSSDDSQNAPGPVLDIWNKGREDAAAAAGADGEVNSRPSATDEATSQLPVHLVAQTEPNMQSEQLRVGQAAVTTAAGGQLDPSAAEAANAAEAADAGGDDMFAEDDMFAAEGDAAAAGVAAGPKKAVVPAGLQDNYDDAEGYYNFQVGEVLDSRYEVFACKGKGVFSTVLRARDLLRYVNPVTGQQVAAGTPGAEHPEVAIKVIRSNETMSKAAALEQRILLMLSEKDPDNKKHVIRLLRTFEFRQHVCMVFEPMDMNLRELTLKYGRNVGLNITAVAIYASQLLVALRHLQQCRVLHADIKPDNILVNARRSKVKICDLGSAMLAGENERTPYLVSRFYRSPEVILGLAYDFPMDMWSVGCVLYELFTGKILFPGRTNNEMLKLMMDVKGPFPKKMLKKGIFVEKHFEDDVQTSFALIEEDPVTKQPVRRVIANPTIKHNFSQLLARAEGDRAQVAALADLLERMCALDPEKRIDPDSALRHPFIKPWLPKKKSGAGH